MNRLLFIFLVLCSFAISSCQFDVHTRIADYGREFEGVLLPRGQELPTWSSDGKLYVQGTKTLFERRGTDWYYVMYSYSSGQLMRKQGEAVQPCYVVFHKEKKLQPLQEAPVLRNKRPAALPEGNEYHEYTEYYPELCSYPWCAYPYFRRRAVSFADAIPVDAVAAADALTVPAADDRWTSESVTPDGLVYVTGESRMTAHAWWAYPLAGAAFVAVDVPCSLVSVLFVPFIELGGNLGLPWFK